MSTRNGYDPGTPGWIDLATPGVDEAKTFFAEVLGWTTEDRHDDDGNLIYVECYLAGDLVAGMGPQQPEMAGMPPIWNSYVFVEDCDATLAKVEAAGGSVMLPTMTVMEAGDMAVFADPVGAALCLWKPDQHHGAERVNEPNTWSWNQLLTRDLDTAKAFYAEVFGWTYDPQDMGTMTYHVIEGGDEGGLGGLMDMPDEVPDQVPSYWGVYFTVADVQATTEAATAAGASVTFGPDDSPVGMMVGLDHPQAGTFTLIQPATG